MHEILFRGKRRDTKEWVLSDSIMQTTYSCTFLWLEGSRFEVIPETVGQYTGLKDKNGIKLFEGDICRVSRGRDVNVGRVELHKFGVYVFCYDKFYLNTFPDIFTSTDDNVWCEVIGNMWDNPELLEELK